MLQVNVVDESVLQTQPVVAMKGVSVRDYGGSGNVVFVISITPIQDEVVRL